NLFATVKFIDTLGWLHHFANTSIYIVESSAVGVIFLLLHWTIIESQTVSCISLNFLLNVGFFTFAVNSLNSKLGDSEYVGIFSVQYSLYLSYNSYLSISFSLSI